METSLLIQRMLFLSFSLFFSLSRQSCARDGKQIRSCDFDDARRWIVHLFEIKSIDKSDDKYIKYKIEKREGKLYPKIIF